MPQIRVSQVTLKGPAGSVTTDKRVVVTQANLHGPTDKRVIISKATLVAPPPDVRVIVSRVRLVGSASPQRPVYYGTTSGWVPVEVYLPIGGVWTKIT